MRARGANVKVWLVFYSGGGDYHQPEKSMVSALREWMAELGKRSQCGRIESR